VGFAPVRPEYRPYCGCPHFAFTRRMEPAFLTVLCAFDLFWLWQYESKVSLLVFRCRRHIFFVSKPYIKCILGGFSFLILCIISNNTTVVQIEITLDKDNRWTETEYITAGIYGNKTDNCTYMYKIILYCKYSMPPTCLEHSCGLLQEGTLQVMRISRYYKICEPMHTCKILSSTNIWFTIHIKI